LFVAFLVTGEFVHPVQPVLVFAIMVPFEVKCWREARRMWIHAKERRKMKRELGV